MSIRDTKQAKRLIEAMAPEGEFLAFINEREAQMLRDAGGSGIMTLAGIPSFFDPGSGKGSVSESLSEAAGLSGPSGDGGGSGFDDTADVNLGLTRGPTINTFGEDQEDDNARMMQALGIPPGVTFSGTSNLINPFPDRGTSVKNIITNAALMKLAKTNPKAYAALQVGGALKGILSAFKNPDLGLDLTRAEKVELGVLKTKQEGAALSPKEQERLEELEQKEAEEKK
jgi:hypothetical protein